MRDLIDRQAAIDRIQGTGYADAIKNNLMLILRLLPSAQPSIRCKDCKYHRYDGNIPYCANIDYGYGWEDNDFCSHAERREE